MISVEKDEARMVRWICRVRPEEKISAKELKLNSEGMFSGHTTTMD